MNDLIRAKKSLICKILLKQITYNINQNVQKSIILMGILNSCFFLRDIHEANLSLEDADDEQSSVAAKLNNLDKGKKQLEKSFFKIT